MQVDRGCEECGTTFTAKSKRAKYCSAKCRVRANRRPTKIGAAKADGLVGEVESKAPEPVYDTLEEQVRQTLTELEALSTISGMNAVRVAQQIDRGRDSGSAVATLSRELSRLVAEAKIESAPKRRDKADDIADRALAKVIRLAG